eukprot:TRINITY_DN7938_c0_g1_i1.p1 TRINITY_DN7938_c0_g1~~TRINITY_DN7938_c0_g1_i1.p1  ORF type:complete len:121 (-),score=24.41 TRINITY_DN7938_c0_g1_i1:81-443(-)
MFTLGCSRPQCEIFFSEQQPAGFEAQNRFVFEYHPHYPAKFVSENVGDPPRFGDQALITDGFTTGQMSFDIQFQSAQVSAHNSKLEMAAQVSDVMRYRLKEACCSRVFRCRDNDDDDDLF